MSETKKRVSVYIGRFQPIHRGHEEVIRDAINKSDHVIMILGSAQSASTVKNPFTIGERSTMIRNFAISEGIPFGKLSIHAVEDYPYSDTEWIACIHQAVQSAISNVMAGHEVEIFLVGSDRDESTYYLKVFPQWKLDLSEPYPDGGNLNATDLRHRLFSRVLGRDEVNETTFPELSVTTREFLQQRFIGTKSYENLVEEEACIRDYKKRWEVAPYPPTFLTADAVVIQSGHLLVVERGQRPGKGLWAIPGGFMNQNERVRDAAVRELIEETGLKLPEAVLKGSIKATETFDHPNRSLRGRTVTFASLFLLDDSKPLPRVKGQNVPDYEANGQVIVETAKAFWLPVHEALANPHKWFEDHLSIIRWGISQIKG